MADHPRTVKRPMSKCTYPGCTVLLPSPGRCQPHGKLTFTRMQKQALERARAPRPQRFYDTTQWQRLRTMVLARDPLCACGAPAQHVDHVQALAKGGDNAFSNLRGMCASCHSRKTMREDSTLGRRQSLRG